MQLTDVELYRYRIPLTHPLQLGDETIHHRRGVLMVLADDEGHTGWGEAAPLPAFSSETLRDVERQAPVLRSSLLRHRLADEGFSLRGPTLPLLNRLALPAALRFGVEEALCHLQAQRHSIPLPRLFTEKPHETVYLNDLVMGPLEEAEQQTRQAARAGYRAVKLKVGRRPLDQEIELVRRLRHVLPSSATLRLDANRAWTLAEARAFDRGIEGCSVEYLEEPLADPSLLPAFAAEAAVPIALDESALDVAPGDISRHGYAAAIVLKPTLLGGLQRSLRFIEEAAAVGVDPVISAAYESGVGLTGLVALAACLPSPTPVGLTTYRRLQADLLTPRLPLDGPCVDVGRVFAASYTLKHEHLTPLPDQSTA